MMALVSSGKSCTALAPALLIKGSSGFETTTRAGQRH